METEETLIRRSRKCIVATFVAFILAWLMIWGRQMMIRARPAAVDRDLRGELGSFSAKLPIPPSDEEIRRQAIRSVNELTAEQRQTERTV